MNGLFLQMQKAAENALKSTSIDEGIKHLANAFALFSEESKRLEESYQTLEKRFLEANTERERTNEELQKKLLEINHLSLYLQGILKNMTEGILFIDREGMITIYNEAAERLLKRDARNKSFWQCFSDEFFGFSIRQSLQYKLSPKVRYITCEKQEVEILSFFLVEGLLILLRDVTEVQKLQREAFRTDRLKELGEMAAAVAHEIRNPLGGIRGYASLLQRDLEGTPGKEMTAAILEGTKTLERLVNNVLQFAKPLHLELMECDINEVVKESVNWLRADPAFGEKIPIHLHLSKKKLSLLLDRALIRSVLLNLLVNGAEAMEGKEGTITLFVGEQNDHAIVTLSDTGIGIEKEDLEKIFSPFFTTKQKGNGLGLSEAYKILHAHLGTIEVRSEKNKGTTFTLQIPLKR